MKMLSQVSAWLVAEGSSSLEAARKFDQPEMVKMMEDAVRDR